MTDAAFRAWLLDPTAIRAVLVEVYAQISGVETQLYLSNRNFVSGGADTPANTAYLACIVGGVQTSESLDLNGGGASISFGDIEIDNSGGVRDGWLGYIWSNRQVQVYLGDPRWPRSDFRKVFDGVVADIGSRDPDVLNIKLLDKLQRLNNPLSTDQLGGTTSNKDRLLPLAFGEVFNVTPLQSNPATLEYQVHNGAIEDIIEVRSNGAVPVAITKDLANGKFKLTASPSGATITASVQGWKPAGTYTNNISTLIQNIVTTYGPSYARFASGDLDTANLSAFATANTQPVGLYAIDRLTVLDACQQLAASVGAQVTVSTLGLLRLVRLSLPAAGTATPITQDDIVYQSLKIEARPTVAATVKLGYCRNWTPQTALAGGLVSSTVPLFTDEWLTSTKTDAATATNYQSPRLLAAGLTNNSETTQQDTLLLTGADAGAEAQRRLDLWKTARTVFSMECLPKMLLAELGDPVTLTHPRFGLASGAPGMIVRIDRDWAAGTVALGVLV